MLKDKRILVLGSTGFVGYHVLDELLNLRVSTSNLNASGSKDHDLTVSVATNNLFRICRPDIIINCAAVQGGIGFNKAHPVEILEQNLLIGRNVLHYANLYNVEKVVNLSASCSYPDGLDVLKEEDYFNGRSHETVAYHGIAKKAIYELGRAYNKQYGMNVINLCLTNLYGPRGHFNEEKSKVVEATIMKVVDAKRKNLPYIEMWGTGKPLREFLYVKDAANLIVQAMEKYDSPEIMNIGSGEETSVHELVSLVCNAVGYDGEVRWLTEKGDGQMKKLLDSSKMRTVLDVKLTNLYHGLRDTIKWYEENLE